MKLSLIRAGLMPYAEAFELQKRLVEIVKAAPDTEAFLVLVEHPAVLTIGRSGDDTDFLVDRSVLAKEGIEVHEVNRGGRTTYHGPGQLVGYPVIPLSGPRRDVHRYLRSIEQVLINVLARWDVTAFRRDGLTGVWTDGGKVAAIGVAMSRWVTYHGFALNVRPNLAHFGLIHPCGLRGEQVATMAKLLGRELSVDDVSTAVIEEFSREFDFDEIIEREDVI